MLKKLWELNISGQRLVETDPGGAGFRATFSSTVTYCHIILLHIWLCLRIGHLKIPFTLVIIYSQFIVVFHVHVHCGYRRTFGEWSDLIFMALGWFGFRFLSRQTYVVDICWSEKHRTSPSGHDIIILWPSGAMAGALPEGAQMTSRACKDVTFKATLEGISKYFRKNVGFQNYVSNILRNFEFWFGSSSSSWILVETYEVDARQRPWARWLSETAAG